MLAGQSWLSDFRCTDLDTWLSNQGCSGPKPALCACSGLRERAYVRLREQSAFWTALEQASHDYLRAYALKLDSSTKLIEEAHVTDAAWRAQRRVRECHFVAKEVLAQSFSGPNALTTLEHHLNHETTKTLENIKTLQEHFIRSASVFPVHRCLSQRRGRNACDASR